MPDPCCQGHVWATPSERWPLNLLPHLQPQAAPRAGWRPRLAKSGCAGMQGLPWSSRDGTSAVLHLHPSRTAVRCLRGDQGSEAGAAAAPPPPQHLPVPAVSAKPRGIPLRSRHCLHIFSKVTPAPRPMARKTLGKANRRRRLCAAPQTTQS